MLLATCPERGEHEFMVRDGTSTEHFWCGGCGQDGSGKRYKCKHCNYRLHDNCYKARLEMKCPSRRVEGHEYISRDGSTPFMCDGCREVGVGIRHKCRFCYYRLHDKCYLLQKGYCKPSPTSAPTTTNANFPGKVFHFVPQNPGNYPDQVCSPCGRNVCGFIFKATDANGRTVFLHPLCSEVKKEWNQLGMKFLLQHKAKAKCLVCHEKKSKGWTYASSCDKYSLHVDCVMELILRSWKEGRLEEARMEKFENVDLAELAEKLEKATSMGRAFKKGGIILLEFVTGMIVGNPGAIGALVAGLLI